MDRRQPKPALSSLFQPLFFLLLVVCGGCASSGSGENATLSSRVQASTVPQVGEPSNEVEETLVLTGATVLANRDFDGLNGKRIGLIANRTSMVNDQSLVDVLAEQPDVELAVIFTPEHGFRANIGAGVLVEGELPGGIDPATGVPVRSLYGRSRAPAPEDLVNLDALVFDLQDAGARYYTYTATMGLAMQAAAQADVPFVVLDRPNPLGGDRSDGPMRQPGAESFVSQYPIPALHGLTSGELAQAIAGEAWLDGLDDLELMVVPVEGWRRADRWPQTGLLWVAPSPGLPTAETTLLYPATVLLEATALSFGRGTSRPFRQVGAPWIDAEELSSRLRGEALPGLSVETTAFTPRPTGDGTEPVFIGRRLPGIRLSVSDVSAIRPGAVGVYLLHHLLAMADGREVIDRPEYFDLLAGGPALRLALEAGEEPSAIVESWDGPLREFDSSMSRYLLYSS